MTTILLILGIITLLIILIILSIICNNVIRCQKYNSEINDDEDDFDYPYENYYL
jgi:hypothetical protein